MSAKYISIKECVAMFCDQYDRSMGDYDKFWVMAFRGLEDMHFNISAEPKTIRIIVNGNMTVTLPPDYVSWVKIGVLNNLGEVSTLRVNNALTTFRDENPNRLELLTADVNSGWSGTNAVFPFVNYFYNGTYTPLFGVGGGLIQFGECRVDEKNNVIILPADYRFDSVLLEYISCPERDEDYMVDRRLREPLITFIAWKMRLDTDVNYYARLTEARRKITPVHLQTFNQIIRENQKFCLKA
jgi:hypothetical protein